MKRIIPADLKKYETKKKVFTAAYYIFIFVAAFGSVYFTIKLSAGEKIERLLLNIGFCLAFLALFYLISRKLLSRFLAKKVFDETYFGKITKVNIKTHRKSLTPEMPKVDSPQYYSRHPYDKVGVNNPEYWDTVFIVDMDVECYDGRKIGTKIVARNCTVESFEKYREGIDVFHLYGTNNIVIMPESDSIHVNCPVCDTLNEIENETCNHCGHSLIKAENFRSAMKDI